MTTIRAEELLERKISKFKIQFAKKPSLDYSLRQCLGEVRGTLHQTLVSKIRREGDKNKRDKLKSKLPGVTLSGVGNRKVKDDIIEPVFKHSGLLQVDLDLDDHRDWQVDKMFEVVNNDKHVLASFLSPSGGVKAVVPIEQKKETHVNCFLHAEEHFAKAGLHMCKATKNLQRLMYLSYDPHPYIADGEVEIFTPLENATQKHRSTETKKRRNASEFLPVSLLDNLDAIDAVEEKTERWLQDPESDPKAVSLWLEFVHERYEPDFHKRNEVLTNFIRYAFERMSKDSAMILARQIHNLWNTICRADISSHMRSAQSLWNGCENSYRSQLGCIELNCYDRLKRVEDRDAFRICRDLANREKGGVGNFFLSSRNLGLRLGFEHTRAWRIIRRLKKRMYINETKKGRQGANGSASEYHWMLMP